MRLAKCRVALLSLICISVACGCASVGSPDVANRNSTSLKVPSEKRAISKSGESDTVLAAGFPKFSQIRIPKPGATAAKQRAAARNAKSIKQRLEESKTASKVKSEEKQSTSTAKEEPKKTAAVTPPKGEVEPSFSPSEPELAGLDQTTQALIRSELRDASTDERAELLQDLKGVSSEMVPKILSVRRAALKYQSQQNRGSISPSSGIAVKDQPQVNEGRPREGIEPVSSGLGSQNPWVANYAAPPVGNGSGVSQATSGPAFPATSGVPAHTVANSNGWSPEQLAAQVLASTASAGLSQSGNKSAMQNGMLPLQALGGLSNTSLPSTPFGNTPQNSPAYPPGAAAGAISGNPAMAFNGGQHSQLQMGGTPPNSVPIATSVGVPAQQGGNVGQTFVSGESLSGSVSGTVPVSEISSPVNQGRSQVEGQPGWMAGSLPNYGNLPPTTHSPEWQQHLQGLISAAEAEAAQLTPGTNEQEKQRYIEAHVHLRMLYMMSGQQQRALAYIPGVDAADQEFWQQVMWGTTNYFDSRQIPQTSDRATQTVAQFQAASHRLREKANLELRGINFCQQINGFGDIEKFPTGNEFTAGQRVLVYAEVVNFKSELGADGRYHSKLKPSYEILRPGGQGELLEQKSYPTIEDTCNNHRQDFYLSFMVDLPEKLGLGPHILRLNVEDEASHKISSQTLNFTVK